jgi:hypothetical protein
MRAVADPALHHEVTENAAWLRDFILWGQDPASNELRRGLVAAVSDATKSGLEIAMYDAAFARPGAPESIPPAVQRTMADAVRAVLPPLATIARRAALRVEPEEAGLRVVIVVIEWAGPPRDPPELSAPTIPAACQLIVAPGGQFELWISHP